MDANRCCRARDRADEVDPCSDRLALRVALLVRQVLPDETAFQKAGVHQVANPLYSMMTQFDPWNMGNIQVETLFFRTVVEDEDHLGRHKRNRASYHHPRVHPSCERRAPVDRVSDVSHVADVYRKFLRVEHMEHRRADLRREVHVGRASQEVDVSRAYVRPGACLLAHMHGATVVHYAAFGRRLLCHSWDRLITYSFADPVDS